MSKKETPITDTSQFRTIQITINNPQEKGFDHDAIKECFAEIKPTLYYCMADEIGGEKQTYHTHIYALFKTPVSFKTLKNRFPVAHFERPNGTRKDNIDYIKKTGKWENTEKELTRVEGTFEEWGTCPTTDVTIDGTNILLSQLYTLVEEGYTNIEIMKQNTDFIAMIDKANMIRFEILKDKFQSTWRDMEVTYIWGDAGLGKTRYVMEKYGYDNVFRVTDYSHPFDAYNCEDIIIFDEYVSNFTTTQFNNYCDGYPLELPSRYHNKFACYTKVYIISNLGIDEQYPNIQKQSVHLWNAIKRRITKLMHFTAPNKWEEFESYEDYSNGFVKVDKGEVIPFPTDFQQAEENAEELPFE